MIWTSVWNKDYIYYSYPQILLIYETEVFSRCSAKNLFNWVLKILNSLWINLWTFKPWEILPAAWRLAKKNKRCNRMQRQQRPIYCRHATRLAFPDQRWSGDLISGLFYANLIGAIELLQLKIGVRSEVSASKVDVRLIPALTLWLDWYEESCLGSRMRFAL